MDTIVQLLTCIALLGMAYSDDDAAAVEENPIVLMNAMVLTADASIETNAMDTPTSSRSIACKFKDPTKWKNKYDLEIVAPDARTVNSALYLLQKDNTQIQFKEGIDDLKASGVYKCRVKDKEGKTVGKENGIYVCVRGGLTFHGDNTKPLHPIVGKDFTWECKYTLTSGMIEKNVYLIHDHAFKTKENNDPTFSGSSYTFKNYSKSTDGDLICQVGIKSRCGNGAVISQTRQLVGYELPSIVGGIETETVKGFQDKSIDLICETKGFPKPIVSWKKADVVIEKGDKYKVTDTTLTIDKLGEDDGGEYTCTATMVADDVDSKEKIVSKSFSLEVLLKPKPTMTTIPTSTVDANNKVSFKEDINVTVTCKYGGEASELSLVPANAKLQVKSAVGASQKSVEFTMSSLNSGQYKCTAVNEAGTGEAVLDVSMMYPPKVTFDQSSPQRLMADKKLTLTCEVDAVPAATKITLSKAGRDVKSETEGTQLIFEEETAEGNFGTYTCTAENTAGSGNADIKIALLTKPKSITVDLMERGVSASFVKVSVSDWLADETGMPDRAEVQFSKISLKQLLSSDFDFATAENKNDNTITTQTFPLVATSPDSIKVRKLPSANDHYVLRMKGINDAGESNWSSLFFFNTTDPTKPTNPDHSKSDCKSLDECYITFSEADDEGHPILYYDVCLCVLQCDAKKPCDSYDEKKRKGDESEPDEKSGLKSIKFKLDPNKLKPNTKYRASVRAHNKLGIGKYGTGSLETGPKGGAIRKEQVTSGTTAAVVVIVVIVLLIVLIVIDLVCYYMNQCGLLMCVCVNCCGKAPPLAANKEIMIEEGAVRHTDKQPLNDAPINGGHDKEADEKVANEDTPMITQQTKTNTDV